MKISEYSKVTTVDSSTVFLLDGTGGTKTVLATDLIKAIAEISDPKLHRLVYGGRSLGATVSEEQKANIRNGSFKGMLVGDYWTIESKKWVIADMDYWLQCGDTALTNHHLVIVPEKNLYSAKMNESGGVTGAYIGSDMYKTGLNNAKELIKRCFPSMVLNRKEYLTNTAASGHASNGAWVASEVELMNEIMVYGCQIFTPGVTDSVIPNKYTTGNSQLAVFALNPNMIKTRETYWLRDVVSASSFALVDSYGSASYLPSTSSLGVRPVFAIG